MNKSVPAYLSILSILCLAFFLTSSTSSSAQVPAWMVDINEEIDMLEENVADCRQGIEAIQAEIDALIKNTPPPITGTPTEAKIRQLQKDRALYRCWADMTDKKIRRLKVIRGVLEKRFNEPGTSQQDKTEINKTKRKVNKVEQDAKNNKRAGQQIENTIKNALGEHK
ncbi:MAG: hypothetical protein AAF587_21205 [Bacteroidota bacterium]